MSQSSSTKGLFVVFEGPDGGGKTMQSQRLLAHLQKLDHEVTLTREPGGTALAELVRDVVLRGNSYGQISPRVEALLLSAARSQHIHEVILPALKAGRVVVCDRFKYSTLAYQGGGSGLGFSDLRFLNEFSSEGLEADVVILLDIESKQGLRRKLGSGDCQGAEWNKMELRGLEYHQRVRSQFQKMASSASDRWLVLDGTADPDHISEEIFRRVAKEMDSRSITSVN